MTPRAEALAFRIWAYASPRGWDCTAGEIADAIGIDYRAIGRVCAAKGWGTERASFEGRFADVLGNFADGFTGNKIAGYARLAEELPE
jgi:hypothetical protein